MALQQRKLISTLKVETHNHPTAISPFPGAATGSGGEIRDEGATGTGAKPKMGLVGFNVSNLKTRKISSLVGKTFKQTTQNCLSSPNYDRSPNWCSRF